MCFDKNHDSMFVIFHVHANIWCNTLDITVLNIFKADSGET
jgi:hypothetical protein